ncbi:MAG: 1,4-dihydroxy-2-naphthoyl-CoA hydrolase in menaquinone biosynthesis [Cytophagales bacterium]|jgi:1,4-dihydroxy-2-naphthoyl-CoA hydrolase|nr:hotdog fold thioesterase [Bacteroidota bacterium]MBS1980134.1 hotdog fold thioesterase [Bacteroidota bacterium]WHZ08644.1 MAG: 1,4-dihydroxy-2-naphthoyl-CoA hydrolase in menaquinone biosynthesis [Cytophagales bacterium]
MGIFKTAPSLNQLNQWNENTLGANLGIVFTEIGDNFIEAIMPVDHRTCQPYRFLHGGASVALAETLGSVASSCCIDTSVQLCFGLEINANHVKSVNQGSVIGRAEPIHIGQRTHVWEIKIKTENGDLVCISRLTVAVIDKKK